MSRIMAVIMVLTIAIPAQAQSAIEVYREKTSVIVRCVQPGGDQIVVCGRRAADRWRVPFVGFAPGDPEGRTVSEERNRLASEPPVRCGTEAMLRNCGMVGVKVSTRFSGSGVRLRKLAD